MNLALVFGIVLIVIVLVAAYVFFLRSGIEISVPTTAEIVASDIVVEELDRATENISVEDIEIAITE